MNLTFGNDLTELYNNTFISLIEIAMWIAKAKTFLLFKNDQNNQERNYRPIALHNMMLKLDTGCMNQFFQGHCQRSNIIRTEQVGGRKKCGNALSNS